MAGVGCDNSTQLTLAADRAFPDGLKIDFQHVVPYVATTMWALGVVVAHPGPQDVIQLGTAEADEEIEAFALDRRDEGFCEGIGVGRGDGGALTIAIPHTDEGMELTLDLMEHQVVSALTRDDTPWAHVWMTLVPRVHQRLSRRRASSENGVRFAARQLVLTCDLIDAPVGGAPLPHSGVWAEVLSMMEADPAMAGIASLIRAEIEGKLVAEWRRAAYDLGVPLGAAAALGLGAADGPPVDPVEFIMGAISGSAGVVAVTEDAP